jgi:hypothetical protein
MTSGDFLNYTLAVAVIVFIALGAFLMIQATLALRIIRTLGFNIIAFLLGIFNIFGRKRR